MTPVNIREGLTLGTQFFLSDCHVLTQHKAWHVVNQFLVTSLGQEENGYN